MRLIHQPMKIIEDNTTIGESRLIKKLWANPELIFIDANSVNGGAAPGFHEKSISNSIITGGGNYLFLLTSGGNALVPHTKNHYHS